jgi:hypothetical protein
MSKALEIAEERLAKGEITDEEFEKIKQRLSSQSTETQPQHAAHTSNVPYGNNVLTFSGKALKYFGAIFLVLFLGNTFAVIPDDIQEYEEAKRSGSPQAQILKVELDDIENRTRIFLFAGGLMLVGGFLLENYKKFDR